MCPLERATRAKAAPGVDRVATTGVSQPVSGAVSLWALAGVEEEG